MLSKIGCLGLVVVVFLAGSSVNAQAQAVESGSWRISVGSPTIIYVNNTTLLQTILVTVCVSTEPVFFFNEPGDVLFGGIGTGQCFTTSTSVVPGGFLEIKPNCGTCFSRGTYSISILASSPT